MDHYIPTFGQLIRILALALVVWEAIALYQGEPSPVIGRLFTKVRSELPARKPHFSSIAEWESACKAAGRVIDTDVSGKRYCDLPGAPKR